MSIEVMKQALEALEEINELSRGPSAICLPAEIDTAMDALKQAIEQAEKPWVKTYAGGKPNYTTPEEKIVPSHQPVAWLSECYNDDNEQIGYTLWDRDVGEGCFPVYTAHAIDISQERVDETAKDRHKFEEMVKKGTKAWDGTPDDWVDDLRGGADKQEPDDIYDVWKEKNNG